MEMPLYQCHKQVHAVKIIGVKIDDHDIGGRPGAVITGEDGNAFRVDADYVDKHAPQADGYYVVYDDGYKSFSPAKAFEDGYTRI